MDYIDKIISWESGELSDKETLELFGELIKTRYAWELQGSYGRTAQNFIEGGWIDTNGEVNWVKYNEVLAEYETKNEEEI